MNSFVIDKRPIALVVLYNPKKQNLENLSHLSLDINIVGWNNSAVDIRGIENKFLIINQEDKEIKNIGLSEGINKITSFLNKKGLQNRCITLLDQDTLLTATQIKNLQNFCKKMNSREKVYIVPEIIGSNGLPWRSWFGITNGMTLEVIDLINAGGFDTKLYADCADIEFSEKLKKLNDKTIDFDKVTIHHNIGDTTKEMLFPDLKNSFKQKKYVKSKYFFHKSKVRRAMKVHSYFYLLFSSDIILRHPIWSIKKVIYVILNIKSIGLRNSVIAISEGFLKNHFPFSKIKK